MGSMKREADSPEVKGSWVRDLLTMADAVLATAEQAARAGRPCPYCARPDAHAPGCAATIAARVRRQARGD